MVLRATRMEERVTLYGFFTAVGQACLRETGHVNVQSGKLSGHGLAIAIFGESEDVPRGHSDRFPQIELALTSGELQVAGFSNGALAYIRHSGRGRVDKSERLTVPRVRARLARSSSGQPG